MWKDDKTDLEIKILNLKFNHMPDIFIANKKEPDELKRESKRKLIKEEEHSVMLHGKEVLDNTAKHIHSSKLLDDISGKKTTSKKIEKTKISNPPGLLSAFRVNPRGLHYNEQDEDEEILLLLRRHFITNTPWVFLSIILLISPFLIAFVFNLTDISFIFSISSSSLLIYISFYYLIVFAYMFINFITWYYNVSLITNKKLVDICFQDVIYHDVSMTKLNLIESVNYVQSGFFGSFFGFGNVYAETAGKSLRFDFISIPKPERVVNILEDLIGGSSDAE